MAPVHSGAATPGLLRRLASLLYDTILVTALLMGATAVLLPLTDGEAIPAFGRLVTVAYQGYLLAVVFAFFAWCWTRGGQTLGMRAWRLHVRNADRTPLGLAGAARRFGAALLLWAPLALVLLWSQRGGLLAYTSAPVAVVFLASLGTQRRPGWHERLSGTRVGMTPKR
ncbi:RDD family protein [Aquisalimonas lutea]|uniref:RDD family protein n=1 Tax=Aquisalimonas lutea TaxID=1327750 RepID=UPI0025B59554|nr:RDD family protein [Aquisalimonas lutea]MDN3519695.1 RDD family protein [Aquisalimonas lutea]